ncbi:MAG: hypothetical protein EBW68_00165, partial [Actinobacteria bacterium]|nr:hypothetical protein [Actinomycetota bacterium]
MNDDEQNDCVKIVLSDRANLSSDKHKLLRIGAKQVSYTQSKASGTITGGTILFNAIDLPDLGNSVISRNMRVRYRVKITAGAGQLGMFDPNAPVNSGVGELHLPYGALRPFPLSTCTNALTVSINGSSSTVQLRDVMSGILRTMPKEYLEKEATEAPSQLDNAWVLVSDNTLGTDTYMATSAQPLSSCYNCPNGTSRASFVPVSYVEGGLLGDEAIFEVTEPILCSPMTLSAEETWLANVNILTVLYVYSNLGDMCVYGTVTTATDTLLPKYPPSYNVELVEGSASLIFAVATIDNRVIVVPPVVNYPYSKPEQHSTHLKPWVLPISKGEVQNTDTVVSQIQLSYTPALIYIYAQVPPIIRAENAVALNNPYADAFYSLGSASGSTTAGLVYDTQQNVLSIRWNRREGFLKGATIQDLYRISVSNGYQSSFNDWLASPIIIINPVKDMGTDFYNEMYPNMAGHNVLTVQCSFNTYNLLTRTAQTILYNIEPPVTQVDEYYSFRNKTQLSHANLYRQTRGVDPAPVLVADFVMTNLVPDPQTGNAYVFYDPTDNVFFAVSSQKIFLYEGVGATLGTLYSEVYVEAITSAKYYNGQVIVCHCITPPNTIPNAVSIYKNTNNVITLVETIIDDVNGHPFSFITSASEDANNLIIANILDISVFSLTGGPNYHYTITPDQMLRAPARRMLGAGAGVPQTTRFVAGGNIGTSGATIAYSDDAGVTWTAGSISSIFTGGVNAVAYGNGIWVAVGYNSLETQNGMIASSPDGINWAVSASGETILGETNGTNVIFGGGIFVVAGEYLGTGTVSNTICTSVDGITWILAPLSYMGYIGGIAFADQIFVIGMLDNNLILGEESEGIWGWSVSQYPIPNGGAYCIAYRALTSQWYVGGGNFYHSADLITWTEDTLAEGLLGSSATSMVYGNGVLIAGTENNTLIIVLDQTGTWTLDNLPVGVYTRQLAYGTSWVAVGSGIAHSGNGTNWTLATNPDILTSAFCVAYGDVLTFNSEYYAYGDGNLHVKLYRGTVNPVDLNPALVLEYDTATEILYAWYDPFTKLLWGTDGSNLYIYTDTGAVLVTYQLPVQMGPCNFYSSRAGPLLAISAFSAPCSVYVYQLEDLVSIVQYGNTISLDFAGNPLGTVSAVAISANNVVISHTTLNQATIISTYTYSNGQYQCTNDFPFSPSLTILGQALDTNTAIYNATTNDGPYIIFETAGVYENFATTSVIINNPDYGSIACFADYVYLGNSYPDRPVFYQGNISTVTTSTVWTQFGSAQQDNYALIRLTHYIQGNTELMVALGQNQTTGNFAIMCNSSGSESGPPTTDFITVSPDFSISYVNTSISVDNLGYVWICAGNQVYKVDQLPEILLTAPYLNWSTITLSSPLFSLAGITTTQISSVTFDNNGGLWALFNSSIYSTQLIDGTYVMTLFVEVAEEQGQTQIIYIPPEIATTGQTGTVINTINKMDYTTGVVLASQNVDVNPNSGIMYDETSGQLRNLIAPIVGFLDTTTLAQQNSMTLDNTQTGVGYTTDAIISYTVTYSLNGGDLPRPTKSPQVAGQRFILASAPTRGGYVFDGWLDSVSSNILNAGTWYTMPAEAVLFTAQWTEEYTVTYILNGPSGTAPTQPDQQVGATFPLATLQTFTGYNFLGWLDSKSGNILSGGATYTMPAENVTFTAQWTYIITYDLAGGSPQSSPETVTALQEFTLPVMPTKDTFTFYGWQLGPQVLPASYAYTMPSAPTAGPLTFTAVWTPPPPVPPTPPAPPATFNQYYSFLGNYEVTAMGYLYSSIGASALTAPTLELSFPIVDSGGNPVVGLGLFYDPIMSSYWLMTETYVYLYNAQGQYVAESIPYSFLRGASFFPSATDPQGQIVAGKLVVWTGTSPAVAYVFSQSGNTIYVSEPITKNYAGATFTILTAGACDTNCLVLMEGSVATVYSSEPTGYVASWDLTLSGLADVASISVDDTYDTLYVCGNTPSGNSTVTSYNLSLGNILATSSTTGVNTMVFDQATSQLRSMEASSSIGFLGLSTLTAVFTASLAPHAPTSFGYSTSPTVPPPVPPVEPIYEYFSFINTSQAYLYQMVIGSAPTVQPTLVMSFIPLDENGNPVVASNLFYDAINQRFWAVNDQYIYVYHRTQLLLAYANVPDIIDATFYPAIGGHSAQVVVSTNNDYVQIWKILGSTLQSVSIISPTTRIGLACASRDATTLIMGFNNVAGANTYDIATSAVINRYDFTQQSVVSAISLDTVGGSFYVNVEGETWMALNYSLLTGDIEGTNVGSYQYYNIIFDTLSQRLMLSADNNVYNLQTKSMAIIRIYTFANTPQMVGYSTSNTPAPTLSSTITYDLNGATGYFPPETHPDGTLFTVQGYGPLPAGFNFVNWLFGSEAVGSYVWWPMPTGGGALVAQWTYDITYDLAGGTSPTPIIQAPVSAGITFTVSSTVPTKTDYIFAGWTNGTTIYQAGSPYPMPVAPTAQPVTLTATWSDTLATATFNLNGAPWTGTSGTTFPNIVVDAGTSFTMWAYATAPLNVPLPVGYIMGIEVPQVTGWNDTATTYVQGTSYNMPQQGVNFTAIWLYTVTYVMAGGTSPTPTQVPVLSGATFVVALPPTRPDFIFAGWTDGTTIYQAGSTYPMLVAPHAVPVILTATWTAVPDTYAVVDMSIDSTQGVFFCILDRYRNGQFVSSRLQVRGIQNGDIGDEIPASVTPINTIIYDSLIYDLVQASTTAVNNVEKLHPADLVQIEDYTLPCVLLGFVSAERVIPPAPEPEPWATLPEIDFQVLTVEEGICQISPDFFRINTACMSLADVKEAIDTASRDGSYIPQSLDDSPRTLFGGQRAVISGTARGYMSDDDDVD